VDLGVKEVCYKRDNVRGMARSPLPGARFSPITAMVGREERVTSKEVADASV
jgi:hypothetical protein